MTNPVTRNRELFEAAVVDRLKESGFLEVEIRIECLARCEDGYEDEVINAGWHYWNAAIAANPSPQNRAADKIRSLAGCYMDALTAILLEADLDAVHAIAAKALSSDAAPQEPEIPRLKRLLAAAKAQIKKMSEAEVDAMLAAQRESWVRGMTTPCEHGVLDFEQCRDCRNPAPHIRNEK